jgi:hypothetical protein
MYGNEKIYLFLEKLWFLFTIAMIPVGSVACILDSWTLVTIYAWLAFGAFFSFVVMGFFDPYGGCP